MAIHHLDWLDDEEQDESRPGAPEKPDDPPPIDHASVAPLTTEEDTEGG